MTFARSRSILGTDPFDRHFCASMRSRAYVCMHAGTYSRTRRTIARAIEWSFGERSYERKCTC